MLAPSFSDLLKNVVAMKVAELNVRILDHRGKVLIHERDALNGYVCPVGTLQISLSGTLVCEITSSTWTSPNITHILQGDLSLNMIQPLGSPIFQVFSRIPRRHKVSKPNACED